VELSAEQIRLLAELGLIAVGEGRLEEAEKIIEAVGAVRPREVAVYIARAMLELRRGQAENAIRLIEQEALQTHPGSPLLQAFLGMALLSAGYAARGRKVLEPVAAGCADERASALARSLLSPGE
jgi:predicted Zn-dependent protease